MSFPVDPLDASAWAPLLTTHSLGRGVNCVLPQADSTNTVLRQLARQGVPHGSLCIADMQTAGKGRLGRSWHSPAGQGLWLSVLVRPILRPEDAPLITLCAAMAMARAVQEVSGLPARIKWPNDLVCHGKKICGILLEISATTDGITHVIIGTGLNVRRSAYPSDLAHQAASLEDFTAPPARADLLVHYLAALEESLLRLESGGFEAIAQEYREACCTLGSRVRVSGGMDLTGEAIDIDHTGALLIRTENGEVHRVLAGDVSVRGVMGYV